MNTHTQTDASRCLHNKSTVMCKSWVTTLSFFSRNGVCSLPLATTGLSHGWGRNLVRMSIHSYLWETLTLLSSNTDVPNKYGANEPINALIQTALLPCESDQGRL